MKSSIRISSVLNLNPTWSMKNESLGFFFVNFCCFISLFSRKIIITFELKGVVDGIYFPIKGKKIMLFCGHVAKS